METVKILLLALLSIIAQCQSCQPFGIRINYGRIVYDPKSEQRLGIRFNTKQECGHVQLLINKFMIVHCASKRGTYYPYNYTIGKQNITNYIHTCSLSRQFQYDQDIEYNLYNVAESKKIFAENIKIRIKNPLKNNQQFTFLHLADWGPVTKNKIHKKYQDISNSIVALINQSKIDCAIINGDIGYELNSNVDHHNLTLKMIQRVSSRVPVIFNRGNHQIGYHNNSVGKMFDDYFQLYDLDINNATGITIGSVFFAIVDPWNLLLPRKYNRYTEESLYSSVRSLDKILQKARSEGKTIVGLSHYPLVCGYPTPGHCIPDQQRLEYLPLYVNLKEINTLMFKYRVPLMLSGHVHTYQRTYPFFQGYRSKIRDKHNYVFDENNPFYVQVTDGVGGSNHGIHENYSFKNKTYDPPAFIASHNLNKTGFGLFYSNRTHLRYEHISLKKGDKKQHMSDYFNIKLPHTVVEEIEQQGESRLQTDL